MAEQLKKVRHDYIRYANCWEDADILLEGLDIKAGDKVLSIGSAGDNSLSLLTGDPEIVVAVDINPVQLQLIALKIAAFKTFDYPTLIQFLGFKDCSQREQLFNDLSIHLKNDQILFWKNRMEEINEGVIYQGKFENYFNYFREKILPKIHSKQEVQNLFKTKNEEEQKRYFDKHWNTWRWRLLFKIFFSKFVMGRLGRDPKFLKQVKMNVSSYILERAKGQLSTKTCQKNYFLKFIMNGSFGSYLPHYVREENFMKIKRNISKLVVFQGLAEDAFHEYQDFNKFNLSNIFEYMDRKTFEAVTKNLVKNGKKTSRYAYWNLMVPQRMSSIVGDLQYEESISNSLLAKDKGFFYSDFIIEEKK